MGSPSRPLAAAYGPDIWGDKFTSIPRDLELWEAYSKERDVLKNEVRSMLVSAGGESTDKIILIDTIERLGVGYHFSECIEDMLAAMHKTHATIESYEKYDLFTTALYFRILRQHGHRVTSEIFNKYKEIDGKFSEAITRDPMGLLSLYEAAHLRTHGEALLDEALAFTTYHLKSMVKSLDSDSVARLVMRALEQPLHQGIQRMEAKHFICYYEECPSRNDVLLKFAKLDFNLLQMLYKQELSLLVSWWADLDVESKLPKFRSRVVEAYVWAVGYSYEPRYALARIMSSKVVSVLSISNDLYDAYGTMDELNIYTKAIERLNVDCIEGLPDYSKICYSTSLNIFSEFDEEIVKQGGYYDVSYHKEAFKAVLLAYHQEAVWRENNYVPPFKEYLMNAEITSGSCILGLSIILGMGYADTVGTCKWATKKPKAVFAAERKGRLINDIVGYEEEHSRPHVATSIDCYMKEYGVSKEEAVVKLYEMIEDTWKDINEECLRPTSVGSHYINIFLDMVRVFDVTYKNRDGYTHPETMKDEIEFLLMDPIPI
uniref:Guaiene synthase n=1 Tax=Thapsia laciniata TaxID=1306261 RepID=A0A3Q8THN8_9APIA|nr:guaiene synthase [Thapsia villosa var. laciniata]